MSSKFGILSKLDFLQDWLSSLMASVNPAVVHNIEKYHALKKVHYLSSIEELTEDYLEFGVFTGSSFCHSMRCCRSLKKISPDYDRMKFFGFDSFSGFGELDEKDKHPFYTDTNFATDYDRVQRRSQRAAKGLTFQLVKGFFSDSLKEGPESFGISKARIIFLDSDTFSSADEALRFCDSITQVGTFLILDDYFSYAGQEDLGVAAAFRDYQTRTGARVRQVFTYGMGGTVFVVSAVNPEPAQETT